MAADYGRERVMIASKQIAFGRGGKRLPYDAEVEYLESTGTQYIKTDIIPTIGYTYKTKFRSTGVVDYGYLFGVNWENDAGEIRFFGLRRLQTHASFQSLDFVIGTVPYEEDIDYDIIINGGDNGILNEFKLSDGRVFTYNRKISVSSTLPLNLLAVNNFGNAVFLNKGRLYSFSVESNGETILDLIPVRVGDVGYMYDRVSGQLFGNAGTGAFVLGPDL
jgi:hypothetical protein